MIPSGARVWIAMGHTDMRRGMQSLAAMVQQHFTKDPFAGDLWVFRGRSGTLVKIIWHDGVGMSLYAKRLEKGRFIWPSAKDGVVSLTSSQLACLLDGVDWRTHESEDRPLEGSRKGKSALHARRNVLRTLCRDHLMPSRRNQKAL